MTQKLQPGKKISAKQVNSDKSLKLFQFLMYDPLYKNMSDRAKILYSFLRDKVSYFKKEQEKFENGVPGSKSYEDSEGNLFILADNTELIYILNASEPTIIKAKKELVNHGLLLETKVKDAANRLYPLEPSLLSESWPYINEIKEQRQEKKEAAKEKRKKTRVNTSNLKNLSHGNLKNLSHGNLKNLSKTKSNVFKSKLIFKTKTNQSIIEAIEKSELSTKIKKALYQNIDRLTDNKIKIIQDQFSRTELPESVFANKVELSLEKSTSNFKGYLMQSLEDAAKKQQQPEQPKQQETRKEMLPDWFHEVKEEERQEAERAAAQSEKELSEEAARLKAEIEAAELEKKRQELEERIKNRRTRKAAASPQSVL